MIFEGECCKGGKQILGLFAHGKSRRSGNGNERERGGRLKKTEPLGNRDTTDLTLFVRTSDEEVARWNRQRIVDALIRETDIDSDTAEAVSREVEKQIMASGNGLLTTRADPELLSKLIDRAGTRRGDMPC